MPSMMPKTNTGSATNKVSHVRSHPIPSDPIRRTTDSFVPNRYPAGTVGDFDDVASPLGGELATLHLPVAVWPRVVAPLFAIHIRHTGTVKQSNNNNNNNSSSNKHSSTQFMTVNFFLPIVLVWNETTTSRYATRNVHTLGLCESVSICLPPLSPHPATLLLPVLY